jgi:hypothetical protein
MLTQVQVLWIFARGFVARRMEGDMGCRFDERGSVVEKVILTAVFAALAIAVGAIIVAKVTDKAHSINLG